MTPPRTRVVARGARVGVPVIDAGAAQVRSARLDHQLGRAALNPTYSDPVLEDMVAEAARQAREDARAQGYAAGWAQGRQAAEAQARREAEELAERTASRQADDARQVTSLLAHLGEAARTARTAQVIDLAEVARAMADAAVELAAAALDRELSSVPDSLRQQVTTALARIADPQAAVVHLNPADAARLGDLSDDVRVVPDASVPAGSAAVLTPAQRLRLDIPAALAAAREVLCP